MASQKLHLRIQTIIPVVDVIDPSFSLSSASMRKPQQTTTVSALPVCFYFLPPKAFDFYTKLFPFIIGSSLILCFSRLDLADHLTWTVIFTSYGQYGRDRKNNSVSTGRDRSTYRLSPRRHRRELHGGNSIGATRPGPLADRARRNEPRLGV